MIEIWHINISKKIFWKLQAFHLKLEVFFKLKRRTVMIVWSEESLERTINMKIKVRTLIFVCSTVDCVAFNSHFSGISQSKLTTWGPYAMGRNVNLLTKNGIFILEWWYFFRLFAIWSHKKKNVDGIGTSVLPRMRLSAWETIEESTNERIVRRSDEKIIFHMVQSKCVFMANDNNYEKVDKNSV